MLRFRTLDSAASNATFTIWNDTHENDITLRALAESLHRHPTDFLFWNGDICNDIGDEEKVIQQFINPAPVPYADRTPLLMSAEITMFAGDSRGNCRATSTVPATVTIINSVTVRSR